MGQIKQNQILPEQSKAPNPVIGLPRDLYTPEVTVNNQAVTSGSSTTDSGNATSAPVDQEPIPHTPAIIEIKEQIVIFNADGSAKIDVILTVEDVESAVEYDVRVTKNAGNV